MLLYGLRWVYYVFGTQTINFIVIWRMGSTSWLSVAIPIKHENYHLAPLYLLAIRFVAETSMSLSSFSHPIRSGNVFKY